MLFLITVPANNVRGPRYMEKALAAFHQARPRHSVSLVYGSRQEQIGLFVRCHPVDRDAVLEPIVAVYPQASVSLADDWNTAGERKTWGCSIELTRELFPILRHAQFEDILNHNFADPVSGLLRSILPDADLECRIEITVRPASRHRCHQARKAVKLLDREFFHKHFRLAHFYASRITRPRRWLSAWLLGFLAWCTPQPTHTMLETSTSRLHEREDDLQAAADKLGGHIFETQLWLTVEADAANAAQALDRLRRMSGALGAYTKSRLATFSLSKPSLLATTIRRVEIGMQIGPTSRERSARKSYPPQRTVESACFSGRFDVKEVDGGRIRSDTSCSSGRDEHS